MNTTRLLEEYHREGLVIVRGVLSDAEVKAAIDDTFDAVLNMPWIDEERETWRTISGIIKIDPFAPVSRSIVKLAKAHYPEMGGFAALTRSPSFHTKEMWKARQNLQLIDLHRAIYNLPTPTPTTHDTVYDDICVNFDRISFKFPGQGDTEFCHWDSNPFTWGNNPELTQGFLALTHTTFRGVPRTHTDAFRNEFVRVYPHSDRPDQYHVYADHDPLKLLERVEDYHLAPGDYVIWSNRLLHEARKNKRDTIRIGYYLSYAPRAMPASCALNDAYRKASITLEDDRRRSFAQGRPTSVVLSLSRVVL